MERDAAPRHACHVYRGAERQAEELTAFLAAGLRAGEQCRVVAYTEAPDRVVGALAAQGFDIADLMLREAIDVLPASSTPLLADRFDARLVLEHVRGLVDVARAAGFLGLRLALDMRWALASSVGEIGLAAFERGVGALVRETPLVVLCQYDAGVFPREWLERTARVHDAVSDDERRPTG